jgi:uncharacterized damage-inducible protein DinB
MPDTPFSLSAKLQSEGEKVFAYFSALAPEQWHQVIDSESAEWTVRSVLAHLVSAEQGFLKIFASIRDGGPGASDDFDIDRYNASQQDKLADVPPAELMTRYQAVRAEMTTFAASLTESDLQKQGRHPALGITTLADMLKLVYLHNTMHLRDVKRVIS